jgi:hypothetical protein
VYKYKNYLYDLSWMDSYINNYLMQFFINLYYIKLLVLSIYGSYNGIEVGSALWLILFLGGINDFLVACS